VTVLGARVPQAELYLNARAPVAGEREGSLRHNEKIIVRKVYEFFCTFIFNFLVNEELFVCAIVFDLSCRMLVFLIASFKC